MRRPFFMSLRDIGFWLRSARADADLARFKQGRGAADAFDLLYGQSIDPWGFDQPQYRYQGLKYRTLISFLPGDRFARALDLGCGTGHLSQLLAGIADSVLGVDISKVAVEEAARRAAHLPALSFRQADVLDLPDDLGEGFDLVLVADVLYYLQPMSDALLKSTAKRIAGLLAPGGLCLLANHFFFDLDPDSRLSRRIHQAFAWSPEFEVVAEHRRPFYLASLLRRIRS